MHITSGWSSHVLRDIIQNPDTFIQVIASFSLLEPERLGYDLKMKIWAPNKPPLHVWDDRLRVEDFKACKYETHWVIEMPSENGTTREVFVTVRALSLERAGVINGRATIVWAVVKLEDMKDRETKNKVNSDYVFE